MNTKHSEPFYISSNLFDNRRLKRRLSKWMERLRARQRELYLDATPFASTSASALKTERCRRRCHLMLSRRRVAATLPADITIDLLSDDDEQKESPAEKLQPTSGLLQLSTVPNITLVPVPVQVPVPVELAPAHSSTALIMPFTRNTYSPEQFRNRLSSPRKRYGDVSSTTTVTLTDSIVLTSDEEEREEENNFTDVRFRRHQLMRSPPPLAPLTFSETVEEVTVSLVPRNSTIANCQARERRLQPRDSLNHGQPNSCSTPRTTRNHFDGYLKVDVASDVTATLPDETTVHTVIANRIYELSLSKLREGLASSGVPEYAHDMLPEQLQKLSPALRAKVAPMVAPSPPAPISLKLSSDLSISLISDDDECENGNAGYGGSKGNELLHPVVAAEAHAAAKLLKQQQPQLSVVQHLQYPGHGTPVALPVMALAATPPTLTAPSTRRRKLG